MSSPSLAARGRSATAAVALVVATLLAAVLPVTGSHAAASQRVIVRTASGAAAGVAAWLADLGADVEVHGALDLLTGTVDAGVVHALQANPAVVQVSEDGQVALRSNSFDAEDDPGFAYRVGYDVIKIDELWKDGYWGQGVDVALIDSGVVPVAGLDLPGKVVNGPDLSFESQVEGLEQLDTYGHGTHLGGLIAGLDREALTYDDPKNFLKAGEFVGMAPKSRLVSVKVADNGGTTDVSQVIAAIDWVVQHRNDNGLNIRVLNLSFGTDSTQSWDVDPLAYAAEVAWDHGIVVVVAAGNGGNDSGGLDDPAYSPHVLAVGAAGPKPGKDSRSDYVLASYSSCGDASRAPDVLAPGTSLVSLRAPGSNADREHAATGAVTDRFFRGTGTSQAAAIVSGGVAALLSAHPDLTPDDVRLLLQREAYDIDVPAVCGGAGLVDFKDAHDHADDVAKYWVEFREDRDKVLLEVEEEGYGHLSEDERDFLAYTAWMDARDGTGLGSLDAARGGAVIYDELEDGTLVALSGEVDIFGQAWDADEWREKSRQGRGWDDGDWNGSSWSGSNWNGSNWNGSNWNGSSWSGSNWNGSNWNGSNWNGSNWNGSNWNDWFWSGNRWSGNAWSGQHWANTYWY